MPEALRQICMTLQLAQPDMGRNGTITKLTLQEIELGTSNPTIDTVQVLLQPF